MRTVIFDLDGTLADTSGDLIAAANVCFHRLGYGDLLDPARDQGTGLLGGRAMLRLGAKRLGLNDKAAETLADTEYHAFLAVYAEDIDRRTAVYPGVEAALDALADDGYILGVCTNKPEALAESLLGKLDLRRRFGAVIGADTLSVRKPHPAPYIAAVTRAGGSVETSVMIGDSVTDRDTARAVGVPSVLVTFGPYGADMAALAPEALLDRYEDLCDIVRGLIG
ncbi:MAG: HAD-IA family hydrolase [Pseudomonadota bacterium]